MHQAIGSDASPPPRGPSRPLSGLTLAALRVLARTPGGLTFPALRAAMDRPCTMSSTVERLAAFGLVERSGSVRHYVYAITPAGRQTLRGGAHAAAPSVHRATWAKAPMVGPPMLVPLATPQRPQPTPISAGIDGRYQVDPATFAGGELSRLRPGQYAAAAGCCAARAKESTKGNQPRFERGREGMKPAGCESAAGRGNGASALTALPHYSSPVGGPMGTGQPAAAGPSEGAR